MSFSRFPQIILFLALGALLMVVCAFKTHGFSRIDWQESTRRKFLLYEGQTISLAGAKQLQQSFVANYPGMTQIDILFKREPNSAAQTVIFQLKTSCEAEADLLRLSSEVPAGEGFIFHPFTFTPLDDSTGQDYCLILQAPNASAQQPLQLQLSNGDLYPKGQTTLNLPTPKAQNNIAFPVNPEQPYTIYLPLIFYQSLAGTPQVEDIGFQLHYSGLLWPTIQQFTARLTANKPYILGLPWFYIGLGLLYLLLLIALFYVARRTVQMNS